MCITKPNMVVLCQRCKHK